MGKQLHNPSFSLKLAPAINVERIGCILFHVRLGLFAVEHIVSAEVKQRRTELAADDSDIAGSFPIYAKSDLRARFALVHRGKRGSMDRNVGPVLLKSSEQACCISYVGVASRERNNLMA